MGWHNPEMLELARRWMNEEVWHIDRHFRRKINDRRGINEYIYKRIKFS